MLGVIDKYPQFAYLLPDDKKDDKKEDKKEKAKAAKKSKRESGNDLLAVGGDRSKKIDRKSVGLPGREEVCR
jgi:hypothetical protein